MKKTILIVGCLIGFVWNGQAQEISKNAIGLRFGGGNGVGTEISYQRRVSGYPTRLEFDLGFRNDDDYNAFQLTGLYQWVWNIDGGFNWYAGFGAGIGSVNDKRHDYHGDDGVYGFIAGDIGIEYDFDIPLQIAIDFRPALLFSNYSDFDDFGPDLALGIRYRF